MYGWFGLKPHFLGRLKHLATRNLQSDNILKIRVRYDDNDAGIILLGNSIHRIACWVTGSQFGILTSICLFK